MASVMFGSGGHARVLLECLLMAEQPLPIAILDHDAGKWGRESFDVPIIGGDDQLSDLIAQGVTEFIVGVGSVGKTTSRQRLYQWGINNGLRPRSVIHPTAIVSPSATIGKGAQLLSGCIVGTNARLGDHVLVNTGAIVEHDCIIGDGVHLATRAALAGTVTVRNGVHIGAGAVVRQNINIGENAVVGMGAVVIRDVPPNVVVMGVPATQREPAT